MQDTYSILREFADSWAMLAIFAFFIGAVLWALRPGGGRIYADTSQIPFRNEDSPAPDEAADAKEVS